MMKSAILVSAVAGSESYGACQGSECDHACSKPTGLGEGAEWFHSGGNFELTTNKTKFAAKTGTHHYFTCKDGYKMVTNDWWKGTVKTIKDEDIVPLKCEEKVWHYQMHDHHYGKDDHHNWALQQNTTFAPHCVKELYEKCKLEDFQQRYYNIKPTQVTAGLTDWRKFYCEDGWQTSDHKSSFWTVCHKTDSHGLWFDFLNPNNQKRCNTPVTTDTCSPFWKIKKTAAEHHITNGPWYSVKNNEWKGFTCADKYMSSHAKWHNGKKYWVVYVKCRDGEWKFDDAEKCKHQVGRELNDEELIEGDVRELEEKSDEELGEEFFGDEVPRELEELVEGVRGLEGLEGESDEEFFGETEVHRELEELELAEEDLQEEAIYV